VNERPESFRTNLSGGEVLLASSVREHDLRCSVRAAVSVTTALEVTTERGAA
jgi:hypothetical protein